MKKTATDSTYYVRYFSGSTVSEFKNSYAPMNLQYIKYFGGSGDVIGQRLNDGGTWKDYYWLKDHLGNTRVVVENFNGTPNVANATDYYPFGAELRSMPSSNIVNEAGKKFKYQGKELDTETKYLNFGGRLLDPDLGRNLQVDRMRESFLTKSPYNAMGNNPINTIDPDGNYEVPATFTNAHPEFAKFIRNGFKEILNNDRIMAGLQAKGHLSRSQVEKVLSDDSGPQINSMKLIPKIINGHAVERFGNYDGNVISLSVDLLNEFKSAIGSDRDALLFLLAVTLLHETVHYGNQIAKNGMDIQGNDKGDLFEKFVYSMGVNRETAKKMIEKYKEQMKSNANNNYLYDARNSSGSEEEADRLSAQDAEDAATRAKNQEDEKDKKP